MVFYSKKYERSTPVGLQLGPMAMYFVRDPDQINLLCSLLPGINHGFNTDVFIRLMLWAPKHVVDLYNADNSGMSAKPLPGSNVEPRNRVRYLQTRSTHRYLTGASAIEMTSQYLSAMVRNEAANTNIGAEWVEMPDLCKFIHNVVFSASVESIYGRELLNVAPDLEKDYILFQRGSVKFFKGFPRWLAPTAYRAREKMNAHLKKWHAVAKGKSDYTRIGEKDENWNPYWGTKLMRARQMIMHEADGMDDDDRASQDVGLMFG